MKIHVNKAKHLYAKTSHAINSNETKPIDVVKNLVNELSRSMDLLLNIKIDAKNQKTRSKHFSRSLVIIYTLQTSLDFDRGDDLAIGLFKIYEYCRVQIINSFTTKVDDGLKKAVKALKEIFEENDGKKEYA